jgi:putative glutamine amidotransferase
MKKPLIGITLDLEDGGSGYSSFPWYALGERYAQAIANVGGLPIPLPPLAETSEANFALSYLDAIDGLLVTGGDFDVDPSLFGAKTKHQTVQTKDGRTAFELAAIQGALERDMPVLGICGGQQLLHVVLGGCLIQHIPDEVENPLAHEQPNPRDEPGHEIIIEKGTLLQTIVKTDRMAVNSAHHQAAKDQPDGVVINAKASDGVIEGIEAPTYRFCLGLQWHPEFLISEEDRLILEAFVAASKT